MKIRDIVCISIIDIMNDSWSHFHSQTPKIFQFMTQCLNEISHSQNLFVNCNDFWCQYLELPSNYCDLQYLQSYFPQLCPILLKKSRFQHVCTDDNSNKNDEKTENIKNIENITNDDLIHEFSSLRVTYKIIYQFSQNNKLSDLFIQECFKCIEKYWNSTDTLNHESGTYVLNVILNGILASYTFIFTNKQLKTILSILYSQYLSKNILIKSKSIETLLQLIIILFDRKNEININIDVSYLLSKGWKLLAKLL